MIKVIYAALLFSLPVVQAFAEVIADGKTWIASESQSAAFVTHSNWEEMIEVVYVGSDHPEYPADWTDITAGWNYYLSAPEISNTRTSVRIELDVQFAPYVRRTVVATVHPRSGNAYINAKNNDKEVLDWLHKNLTSDDKNIAYIQITMPIVEESYEVVGTSRGEQLVRRGRETTTTFGFGLRNAREAIEQAKANWKVE